MIFSRRKPPTRLALLLALWPALPLALAPRDAFAVGETNSRLKGRVIEAGTGVPVPGMRVTLRGESLQGARTEVTDDNGGYDFLNLPPGTYDVTFAIEGVQPMRRRTTVRIGETQDLSLQFSAELASVQTETIVEERKKLDISRPNVGRVLTSDQQAQIALPNRRYQDLADQIPGVIGTGNPYMAGANFRHNHYLVDGLDTTDPVTNTFSANFNFDAINQLEVLTIPVDAQYNSLGGVVNLVTKSGSDKFHADSSFYLNNTAFSGGALAGTQLYEGPLYNQTGPRPPNSSYQANINLSGPIVKQRLWYYIAAEFDDQLTSIVPGPPLNYQHPGRTFIKLLTRAKITWRVAARHQIELTFNADPAWLHNTVQANTTAPEAETYQSQGGQFATINYDWAIRDNLFFKLQTGVVAERLQVGPMTNDRINPGQFELNSASQINFVNVSGPAFVDDQRLRLQFDPTLTWVKKGWLGEHTFKMGLQTQFIRQYQYSAATGDIAYTNYTSDPALLRNPTGFNNPAACNPLQPHPVAGDSSTSCYQATNYQPPYAQVRVGWGAGAFVQDTWKPTSWLTIMPGLRVDYGIAQNSLGQVTQNLLGFGPRIFAAVDLTRDGKTALKFAYGRANEVTTLLYAGNLDTGGKALTYQYNATTGRFDNFIQGSGGSSGYDLRGRCPDGTFTLACGNGALSIHPPVSDFITASIERDVVRNVFARITYTYRLQTYQWEDYTLNAPHTLDGKWLTQFNNQVTAARPTPDAWRRYNGLDFELDARRSNYFFIISYTLSFLDGTVDDAFGPLYDDPQRNYRLRGYLPEDSRHSIKSQSSYTWRGLQMGVNLTYATGTPVTRIYQTPLGYIGRYGWYGVDPSATADPNNIRTWTELRYPDQFVVNLRVQYDIGALFHNKYGALSVIADLFNALNLQTPTAFNSNDGSLFGTVATRLAPIRLQLGARYQY